MPRKPGPTGDFPLGRPIGLQDRGGLYASFGVLKGDLGTFLKYGTDRLCELEFGTVLSYFEAPIVETQTLIAAFRQKITETWGDIPFDKTVLRSQTGIEVNLIRHNVVQAITVRTTLPRACPGLIANPETFLAWCAVMEDRIKEEMS